MSQQYIFQMSNMTKKHGQKETLKDIHLSFFPGAKIGVLGRNGADSQPVTCLRSHSLTQKRMSGKTSKTQFPIDVTCSRNTMT